MSFGGYDTPADMPWIRPLLPASLDTPVLIDTQALRPRFKALAEGLSSDDRARFRAELFGFEAVMLFPRSAKATWRLTGFVPP